MDWLNNLEARCFPAPEVERQLGVGDETPALPPTKAQMRQVIAAVRLAEKEAAEATWELQNEVDPVKVEARLDELVRCLCSGEVEDTPPPKDKPAPSDDKDKQLRDLADDLVDGSFSGADDAKATTSEDEGERWAKVLRQVIFCAFLPPLVSRVDFGDVDKRLDQLDAETQRRIKQAALRFRAKCAAPLEKALRGIIQATTSGPWFKADIKACAEKALSAFPDLGEPAEDKPLPTVTVGDGDGGKERFAKTLWEMVRENWKECGVICCAWESLGAKTRALYLSAASRFHDECREEFRELVEAAGRVGDTWHRANIKTDRTRADWLVSYPDMERLCSALNELSALPSST